MKPTALGKKCRNRRYSFLAEVCETLRSKSFCLSFFPLLERSFKPAAAEVHELGSYTLSRGKTNEGGGG